MKILNVDFLNLNILKYRNQKYQYEFDQNLIHENT